VFRTALRKLQSQPGHTAERIVAALVESGGGSGDAAVQPAERFLPVVGQRMAAGFGALESLADGVAAGEHVAVPADAARGAHAGHRAGHGERVVRVVQDQDFHR